MILFLPNSISCIGTNEISITELWNNGVCLKKSNLKFKYTNPKQIYIQIPYAKVDWLYGKRQIMEHSFGSSLLCSISIKKTPVVFSYRRMQMKDFEWHYVIICFTHKPIILPWSIWIRNTVQLCVKGSLFLFQFLFNGTGTGCNLGNIHPFAQWADWDTLFTRDLHF